jgi:hypothetical protein
MESPCSSETSEYAYRTARGGTTQRTTAKWSLRFYPMEPVQRRGRDPSFEQGEPIAWECSLQLNVRVAFRALYIQTLRFISVQ